MQTIKLNNGITCPVIGLGTFMLSPSNALIVSFISFPSFFSFPTPKTQSRTR